jgi:DNA polymerase III alpha subunit
MRYNNYHKHTHYSSIFTPDSCCKIDEYIKRIIELNHTTYFTTEHGWGGDIFEAKELCNKYNVKCVYGLEGYIVNNPLEKDKSNYHIVIIPKTNIARKKLNKINTRANKDGFY